MYYGWRLVLTLGVTETISWGILYYSFTVFLAPMEADLGWSRAATSGAFSVALLVSAVAALPVGRWLDRRGGRGLMTAGSLAGALLVVAWALVERLATFYAVWVAIGAVMATLLYEPAFTIVARWFARDRARALTAVTLMAGFASTVFIPLSGWLVERVGWRQALLVLAALQLATALPHAVVLRRSPEDLGVGPDGDPLPAGAGGARSASRPGMSLGTALRDPTFRWLTAGFALTAFAQVGASVHLVPYFLGRGYDPRVAATAAGLLGAVQVGARLVFARLERRLTRRALATVVYLLPPAALALVLVVPGVTGITLFIAVFGAGRGLTTLARALLVADVYGASRYGSASGAIALFATTAQAAAPAVVGAAYDLAGGYDPVFWALAALSLLAAAAVGRVAGATPRPGG
ncbi:MAG TPA: MFS transporter [Thermodesulfobacteriota bacterium]